MTTKTSKNNAKTEGYKNERKELKECLSLWKKKSQSGKSYFKGKTVEGKHVIAFYNMDKKNPKEPDLRICYMNSEGKAEYETFVSLWCNATDSGTKYLSGKISGIRVVGFFTKSEALVKHENLPYIKLYWADSEGAEHSSKAKEKEFEEVENDELPF